MTLAASHRRFYNLVKTLGRTSDQPVATWRSSGTSDHYKVRYGYSHAMAQVVSCWPLTTKTQVSPCGICDGQISNGTHFTLSSSGFPCQCHSTMAVHTHASSGGWTIGLVVATVQRQCHPINMNKVWILNCNYYASCSAKRFTPFAVQSLTVAYRKLSPHASACIEREWNLSWTQIHFRHAVIILPYVWRLLTKNCSLLDEVHWKFLMY
jgi:hypothetical protein